MAAKKKKSQTDARRRLLLFILSDGDSHSGQAIAKRLRISRAGVWKLVQSLRTTGIDIQSVPRQGYSLPHAIDLLDRGAILESLPAATRERLDRLDVLLSVDSTNRHVRTQADAEAECVHVCLTELQTAGRGRRGRSWVAPLASGICMSLGWQFSEAPPTFSALSLAIGVAAVRALERCGVQGVGLKWPNDLLWNHRKLGGILIEMQGESDGPAHVVIGIGINMHMPPAVRLQLAEHQAVLIADVHEILRDRTPKRNALAAILIAEMISVLNVFGQRGFAPFAEQWRSLDVLANVNVQILNGAESISGIARSVDENGALSVEVNGKLRRFVSGEVSVRAGGRRTTEGGR